MSRALLVVSLALGALALAAAPSAAATPEELLRNTCSGCHQPDASGALSRISQQRKTPEGWAMTIQRMEDLHGITVSSQDLPLGSADAKRALVKHLADTQGLAPSETAGFRYALEQRLDEIEPVDAEFKMMCGRCHSAARVVLQRRPLEEWKKLVHFHLGQWPSTEYSAGGRNLDWLPVALNETAPMLAEKYGLESAEWEKWKKAKKPALAGEWTLFGHQLAKGDFRGRMTAVRSGADEYAVTFEGAYTRSGEKLSGSGTAVVYTGYEWRATLTLGDAKWQQVMQAVPLAAPKLAGRMYERAHPEHGLALEAFQPRAYVTSSPLLSDAPASALGAGRVDRISVDPPYQVARVGDGGGPIPKEFGVFDAVAWSNGPDGKPETADDVRIGAVPATWRSEPWNELAREERDVEFAGNFEDPSVGVFTPGDAGPNPARKYGTNNAGNLKVIATVKDGERELTAEAQLIVTVQRWIHSPIP